MVLTPFVIITTTRLFLLSLSHCRAYEIEDSSMLKVVHCTFCKTIGVNGLIAGNYHTKTRAAIMAITTVTTTGVT
jgi:hypothetical protein